MLVAPVMSRISVTPVISGVNNNVKPAVNKDSVSFAGNDDKHAQKYITTLAAALAVLGGAMPQEVQGQEFIPKTAKVRSATVYNNGIGESRLVAAIPEGKQDTTYVLVDYRNGLSYVGESVQKTGKGEYNIVKNEVAAAKPAVTKPSVEGDPPELKIGEWVEFEDDDGIRKAVKLTSTTGSTSHFDRIQVLLLDTDELSEEQLISGEVVKYVFGREQDDDAVHFNDGQFRTYYIRRGNSPSCAKFVDYVNTALASSKSRASVKISAPD
ncbi:MAG: hypothetical protein LBK53_04600 [Heliobacteriaceae bacterium]|jgi:hypothetical protein|nr:hypothetical protein [Heliobacteriaceae bacterium]